MSNVSLVDVRNIDGEVWDVAAVAGKQTGEALALSSEALAAFKWATKGAWLSQEHYRTGEMPGPGAFEQSALGSRLTLAATELQRLADAVRIATTAASYDPRSV